jgi:hypothetical protein
MICTEVPWQPAVCWLAKDFHCTLCQQHFAQKNSLQAVELHHACFHATDLDSIMSIFDLPAHFVCLILHRLQRGKHILKLCMLVDVANSDRVIANAGTHIPVCASLQSNKEVNDEMQCDYAEKMQQHQAQLEAAQQAIAAAQARFAEHDKAQKQALEQKQAKEEELHNAQQRFVLAVMGFKPGSCLWCGLYLKVAGCTEQS